MINANDLKNLAKTGKLDEEIIFGIVCNIIEEYEMQITFQIVNYNRAILTFENDVYYDPAIESEKILIKDKSTWPFRVNDEKIKEQLFKKFKKNGFDVIMNLTKTCMFITLPKD